MDAAYSTNTRQPPRGLIPENDLQKRDEFLKAQADGTLHGIALKRKEILTQEIYKKTVGFERFNEAALQCAIDLAEINSAVYPTVVSPAGIAISLTALPLIFGAIGVTIATGGAAIPLMTPGVFLGGWLGSSLGVLTFAGYNEAAHATQVAHEKYIAGAPARHQAAVEAHEAKIESEMTDLFRHFFRLHADQITPEQMDELEALSYCPITMSFPYIPVFSPHDAARSCPFEKVAILEHLRGVEANIAQLLASGYDVQSPTVLQAKLRADPYRRGYFTAAELIFDRDHVRKRICALNRVHDAMHSELYREGSTRLDSVQATTFHAIVDFYARSYGPSGENCPMNNLIDDLMSVYTTPESLTEAINGEIERA